MNRLSNRITSLSESQTIAMSQKSRELKAQGVDVISLSLGEPDFDPPQHVLDAAKSAIDGDFNHYPPVPGYMDLREAISKKFKEQNGLDYSPTQIVVSTGAKQSIANLVLSLVNPGDEVIILSPYWVSYQALVQLAEADVKYVKAEISTDFKVTPEQLDAAITDNTKLIMFSSPSNPTGGSYSAHDMAGLARVIGKHKHVVAMADEIYEHITFEGEHVSLASFPEVADQVVTVNGVSKAYAMTGWRIGYIGAPIDIAKACAKMQGQFTSGANSIGQRAAIAALSTSKDDLNKQRDVFRSRRDLFVSLFREVNGFEINVPTGAFYLFPKVEGTFGKSHSWGLINSSEDLCNYLLEEAHVATVPGEAFGAPGYIRMSYAASEAELKEAARRIKEAVDALS
ncbi:MAG: aspartate aminotransferase [Bacteroidia bacterium]|jgi:aspartate aminotransferase